MTVVYVLIGFFAASCILALLAGRYFFRAAAEYDRSMEQPPKAVRQSFYHEYPAE